MENKGNIWMKSSENCTRVLPLARLNVRRGETKATLVESSETAVRSQREHVSPTAEERPLLEEVFKQRSEDRDCGHYSV
jgi:hypothetical protein